MPWYACMDGTVYVVRVVVVVVAVVVAREEGDQSMQGVSGSTKS